MTPGPVNHELPFDAPPGPAPALRDRAALLALLDNWAERGWLRRLDLAFVRFLYDCDADADPRVVVAAALASHQLGHGHVCLDLAATLDSPGETLSLPPEADAAPAVPLPADVLAGLDLESWQRALASSALVALPPGAAETGDGRPLVLDGARLYLRRYWHIEGCIAAALRQRLAQPGDEVPGLAAALARLFEAAPADAPRPDWQKLACAIAARGRIAIITGGPGTGKTTTVVRLLALLHMAAAEQGRPLRMLLAAPTGKAAARLSASIAEQAGRLPVPQAVRAAISSAASTLHRLLGSRPDTRHFRHHAGNPLPTDLLVVDEASMVDVEMMACLLDALPPRAKLVLLGDKDQLASVEAGAVLGDLCRDAEAGHYTPQTRQWLEAVSGECLDDPALQPGDPVRHAMAQQTVMLRHSRRFGAGSGIGLLARAVNAGDADEARRLLAPPAPAADLYDVRAPRPEALERLLLDGHAPPVGPPGGPPGPRGYARYLEIMHGRRPPPETPADDPAWTAWALAVLAAFDEFRLLCALRGGEHGVEGLNARVARALRARGLIEHDAGWFEGRPVLATRNDYALGLMNGDIGIALRVPQLQPPAPARVPGGSTLRVAFARGDGTPGVRWVLPSRLNAIETVFAMTVHKSQGSEFAHTALLLPDRAGPILTRELIYTGVTRARNWFTLIEPASGVLEEAVRRRVRRVSGLRI